MKIVVVLVVLGFFLACAHASSDVSAKCRPDLIECDIPEMHRPDIGSCDPAESCMGGTHSNNGPSRDYGPRPATWKSTIEGVAMVIKEIVLTVMVVDFMTKGIAKIFKKKTE